MHFGRITTIVGSVLAIIGLGLVSASSAAESLMPDLNAATEGAIPAGFDRVFTAFWNESAAGAAVFVIALVVVLGVSLIPDMKEALTRMNALVVTVLGVVMLVVGGLATSGALDDASDLQAAFAQMAAGGQIPEAYTVSASVGWYLLAFAGVVVAIGGVLALIARPDESALSD
ncbi:MAG: hypothetical protein ABFR95_02800 [Actinomycetota bacterium]